MVIKYYFFSFVKSNIVKNGLDRMCRSSRVHCLDNIRLYWKHSVFYLSNWVILYLLLNNWQYFIWFLKFYGVCVFVYYSNYIFQYFHLNSIHFIFICFHWANNFKEFIEFLYYYRNESCWSKKQCQMYKHFEHSTNIFITHF